MAPDPLDLWGDAVKSVTLIRRRGAVLDTSRELDCLPLGSIVRADSSPAPAYFRRSSLGWLACHEDGDTRLHAELVVELSGWPAALPTNELRRPAVVVELPTELVLPPRDRPRHKKVTQ